MSSNSFNQSNSFDQSNQDLNTARNNDVERALDATGTKNDAGQSGAGLIDPTLSSQNPFSGGIRDTTGTGRQFATEQDNSLGKDSSSDFGVGSGQVGYGSSASQQYDQSSRPDNTLGKDSSSDFGTDPGQVGYGSSPLKQYGQPEGTPYGSTHTGQGQEPYGRDQGDTQLGQDTGLGAGNVRDAAGGQFGQDSGLGSGNVKDAAFGDQTKSGSGTGTDNQYSAYTTEHHGGGAGHLNPQQDRDDNYGKTDTDFKTPSKTDKLVGRVKEVTGKVMDKPGLVERGAEQRTAAERN